MTPEQFCHLALSFPETSGNPESERPDFQVDGKVFASLFPADGWGVIKMDREVQAIMVQEEPDAFQACAGAWGENGATIVVLEQVEEGSLIRALLSAWRKNAPKPLAQEYDDGDWRIPS